MLLSLKPLTPGATATGFLLEVANAFSQLAEGIAMLTIGLSPKDKFRLNNVTVQLIECNGDSAVLELNGRTRDVGRIEEISIAGFIVEIDCDSDNTVTFGIPDEAAHLVEQLPALTSPVLVEDE